MFEYKLATPFLQTESYHEAACSIRTYVCLECPHTTREATITSNISMDDLEIMSKNRMLNKNKYFRL